MIGEWLVPFWLTVSDLGSTLYFNETDTAGHRFQLVSDACTATLPVRVTEDDMPQHDGKVPHRRWRSGYQIHLVVEPLVDGPDGLDCAGGADLVEMLDQLGLFLNSMIRTGLFPGAPNARLLWSPSGQPDDRMLDRVQLLGAPTLSQDGALGGVRVEFDLDSPYPYYISATETDSPLTSTGPVTLTNAGSADFYPVIEVYGATSGFTITNLSVEDIDGNPLEIDYNDALPGAVAIGGGDHVEIINFQGTVFLNGDQSNRMAGINMLLTDFFPLVPGDNDLTIVGATAVVKWNSAWA